MLVYLKRVTFDIDKVSCISIEETDRAVDVVLYLENSRHVIHRLNINGTEEYSDIKSVELIKEFYDQLILEVLRRDRTGNLSKRGENFKHLELKLDNIVDNFKNYFLTNEEYLRLNNESLNIETFSEALEVRNKIEGISKEVYDNAVYEISRLFK